MATRKKKTTEIGFLQGLSGVDLVIRITLGAIALFGLYAGINQYQKTIGNGKPPMGNPDGQTIGNGKPKMGN